MKTQPSPERPWGYHEDTSLFVNGVEIVIPKGSYPTCDAVCAAINERCGREIAFPGEPEDEMWVVGFDDFELAVLDFMRKTAKEAM